MFLQYIGHVKITLLSTVVEVTHINSIEHSDLLPYPKNLNNLIVDNMQHACLCLGAGERYMTIQSSTIDGFL
jgi:hypothetical protein